VLAWRYGSNNYAHVWGTGSVWRNTGNLLVGLTGNWNHVLIDAGARLNTETTFVGFASASTGNTVVVDGAGSSWSNAGPLTVGFGGPGNSLVISAGARVYAGSVAVGALGTARSCSIELRTGTLLSASSAVINTNALLAGNGMISATTIQNYGTISPGLSIGSITGNAMLVMGNSGTVSFELAGYGAGSGFDQLYLSGGIAVGGTLRVERVRGFVPKTGDSFKLIPCGPITGSNFGALDFPPWFVWAVSYQNNTGVFLVVTSVDTATNGVPKAWLADNGWTNNFDVAATNDADGDHVATWEEYYAGTDPTNGSSFFQCLEISKTNLPTLGKILRWNAVSGCVYGVEAATNLLSGWQELTNNLAAPINSWTDTAGSVNGQYRIRVQKP